MNNEYTTKNLESDLINLIRSSDPIEVKIMNADLIIFLAAVKLGINHNEVNDLATKLFLAQDEKTFK